MTRVTDDVSYAALLALAESAAREAGALLQRMQADVRGIRGIETKSSATDMVSDADRASERLIVERILAARPDDAVLGEEGGERAGSSGVRWVIDPLDGTTNYLYGVPAYAVSIGVEVEGVAVAGVVYDVARGETFTASLGGGAFRDGGAIAVSRLGELATALVATGFNYDARERARQGTVLAGVLPRVRDIRRGGAAAIDLCWVACGRVDAYFERGTQPWDYTAGALIVREAGGATSGLDGGTIGPASVVAASPALLGPLCALLRESGA